ncbi:hypothetical protein ABW20_dc0108838 [Dactylellina cionopaga]|nr:hypothetical protein ABW20_dc0108838 [Dactylellina cionopaga]
MSAIQNLLNPIFAKPLAVQTAAARINKTVPAPIANAAKFRIADATVAENAHVGMSVTAERSGTAVV